MLQAAFLVFDGVDVLDFAGPLEIFSHVHHSMNHSAPDPAFELTIIGRNEKVSTSTSLQIISGITLATAHSKLKDFDVLVVPGGPPQIVLPLVESESEELQFVRDFGLQAPREGRLPQTILSICTGSLFLGASGLLDGMKATTHHLFLDELRTLCDKKGKTEVIQARYVDGGVRANNIQIITGGGVSSGLDSACYFVSRTYSPEMASFAAKMTEYHWNEL